VFDRRLIYTLTQAFQDQSGPELQAGARVIETSFDGPWLAHLTAINFAVPHVSPEEASASQLAQNKVLRIRQQAEQQNEHGHPTLYGHDGGGVSRGGSIH
jgi:hypothetical protein